MESVERVDEFLRVAFLTKRSSGSGEKKLHASTVFYAACSLALLSDGSTQYTIQTLWSLAHEKLNVVVLITANHQYAILRNELRRNGAPLSAQAAHLTDLGSPAIDWVGLAQAYGVPASRSTTAEELAAQLDHALSQPGPFLIEMAL